MKLKLYKAVQRHKVELVWTIDVDPSLRDRGHTWFRRALDSDEWDIEQDQLDIREQFPSSLKVEQGDLICVGGSQCYIM